MSTATRSLPLLDPRPSFDRALETQGASPLMRERVQTLQINLGKLCNMACLHCHVEAGPQRTEVMERDAVERLVQLLAKSPDVEVVDLTGGAPELNPHFRYLVEQAKRMGRRVIDRCNLTILFEPGCEDLAEFLAAQEVEIVASLPCYSADNVEAQRGSGAFDKSIQALRLLNELGYGQPGSSLKLSLVYNPTGASLPPDQLGLEKAYERELSKHFGIAFNELLTITNMPIKRFRHALEREQKLGDYMRLLEDNFNVDTVAGLMCRSLVSVGWDGRLYDCDFNQMLEISAETQAQTIWDIESLAEFAQTHIATNSHCFGCTAGAGSSCSGALR